MQDNNKFRYQEMLPCAISANAPADMPSDTWMRRRLISSMLTDIKPEHCTSAIKSILQNIHAPQSFYTSIIIDLLPHMSSNQRKHVIDCILRRYVKYRGQWDEHEQFIKEMSPYIPQLCLHVIISILKYSTAFPDRENMMGILDNTDHYDQRCMIESMLPKTTEDQQKAIIIFALASSTPGQRGCMIDALLGTAFEHHETMIRSICSQPRYVFKSLVVSMLANTNRRYYKGMVEILLQWITRWEELHYTLLNQIFLHLITDLLTRDLQFQHEWSQYGIYQDSCDVSSFMAVFTNKELLLDILDNIKGDLLKSELRKVVERIRGLKVREQ